MDSKSREILRSERGQSMVVIALALTSMIAMAGLVLDGGNAYLQRREAQNAADSAALAGAWQMSQIGATNGQVAVSVNDYVARNGASASSVVYVQSNGAAMNAVSSYTASSAPPAGAVGVSVAAGKSVPTFFMRVLSINTVSAVADAAAMTGPVSAVNGLVPMALNLDAASSPVGTLVSLSSPLGDGGNGTYNLQSIDTVAAGLGPFRDAMCNGIQTGVTIGLGSYRAYQNPTLLDDERYCLNQRIGLAPSETWNNFATGSPRMMLVPVANGDMGEGSIRIIGFRAFFLERVDGSNTVYGRFLRTIVGDARIDFTAPNYGVVTVKLTH
jgi:Flp pilus assembly protein TadG